MPQYVGDSMTLNYIFQTEWYYANYFIHKLLTHIYFEPFIQSLVCVVT